MIRIQILYSKTGAFRYTGNLDVHKTWERIFRRAGLPLAYSQGFHPQPKLNQANPLPLGIAGRNELIEVWLNCEQWDTDYLDVINQVLPPGIKINDIRLVALNAPTPQSQIVATEYLAELPSVYNLQEIVQNIKRILDSDELIRERRGKSYNLRPLIFDLWMDREQQNQNTLKIGMRLAAGPQGSGRPDEVLLAVGLDSYTADIERTQIIFTD